MNRCRRALARGTAPKEVVRAIAEYRQGDKHDPEDYARHTVMKAQAQLEGRGAEDEAPADTDHPQPKPAGLSLGSPFLSHHLLKTNQLVKSLVVAPWMHMPLRNPAGLPSLRWPDPAQVQAHANDSYKATNHSDDDRLILREAALARRLLSRAATKSSAHASRHMWQSFMCPPKLPARPTKAAAPKQHFAGT